MARGVGVIYFAILPGESSEAAKQQVVQASDNILSACAALGGNATIPWCPTEWKNALKVWGLPRADFAQMLKVKKSLRSRPHFQSRPLRGRNLNHARDSSAISRRRPTRIRSHAQRLFRPPISRNTKTTRAASIAACVRTIAPPIAYGDVKQIHLADAYAKWLWSIRAAWKSATLLSRTSIAA